jgi:hypothetical protein
MKHFSIDIENNITVHASRKAARETGNGVFASEEQFAEIMGQNSAKRLVEIWNSLPGVTPVKKFTSTEVAINRIWKAIQSLETTEELAAAEPVQDVRYDPPTKNGVLATEPEQAPAKAKATREKKATAATEKATGPRDGSKTSRVVELLKRKGGITLKELSTEMGWQEHTTRALLSAGGSLAKKHGVTVVSTKPENGERIYSL